MNNLLNKVIYKSALWFKRRSPIILTCIGAFGVAATAVTAVRATPKAMQILEAAENEKGEELTKAEIVKAAAPVYIPSVIIGLSAVICIFGANVLNEKKQASLISAYALLDESYKKYRTAAKTVYGKDADDAIRTEMARDSYVSADGYAVYDPDMDESDKVLFYDSYSRRYFTSTMASVINAQYHVNHNYTLRGYVCVNEFYEFLGIDRIDGGDDVGWSMDELMEDGILWLDFENRYTQLDDGLECYIISTPFYPTLLYP